MSESQSPDSTLAEMLANKDPRLDQFASSLPDDVEADEAARMLRKVIQQRCGSIRPSRTQELAMAINDASLLLQIHSELEYSCRAASAIVHNFEHHRSSFDF